MENLIAFQIQLIQWLQALGEWLTAPMEYLSLTGSEQFYLLIAPAIYWCWDTVLGLQTGLFLMLNANLNAYLKILFSTGRPFWISASIKHLAFESSFGLPSGHAQNAAVFWGTIGAFFRKSWLWILLIILIFLVGISRLYLAVHFPHDVLIGWLVGALALWLFLRLSKPVTSWIMKRPLSMQILTILVGSLCLILIGFLIRLAVSDFVLPGEWVANAAASFPEEDPINPLDISGIVSNAGAFFGLAAGACWLRILGGFDVSGSAVQRLGRYTLGVLGVFILWFGLGEVFPRGETWLPYILRYLRYGLVGFWVTALAPLLFIKIRLANRKVQ
jgi:membrane-associated phospholipid phosphatase